MSELLNPTNFDEINITERTKVDSDAAAGQKAITVKNIQGIDTDEYIVVGRVGQEQSELQQEASVSGSVLTLLANLDFAHKKGEELVVLAGNQIKIYRAPNVDDTPPDDSAFASIKTLDIEADQLFTPYTDATGGSDFWYKKTYFNETTSVETDLANSVAQRGGDFGHYVTLVEIRKEAGFQNNFDIDDGKIDDRREDAESEVKGILHSTGYTLPLSDPIPKVVRNITRLLAAGYLLLEDYGVEADGTNKEGEKKLNLAEKMLEKIADKKIQLLNQYLETAASQSTSLGGWPDNTTKDADPEDSGGKRIFRITEKF